MSNQQLMFQSLQFAQRFDGRSHSTKEAITIAGSKDKAYRQLNDLKLHGIIDYYRYKRQGYFTVNTILAWQPYYVIERILPSLESLKKARRFGRRYDGRDIEFAMKNVNHKMVTLDYAAWELTQMQSPSDYSIYVQDMEKTASYLKENKFHEGRKGHVVILPAIGDFSNEIQRIYFDCIAYGGRSIQDAIAIYSKYRDRLDYKALFPIEMMEGVQDDLPRKT